MVSIRPRAAVQWDASGIYHKTTALPDIYQGHNQLIGKSASCDLGGTNLLRVANSEAIQRDLDRQVSWDLPFNLHKRQWLM